MHSGVYEVKGVVEGEPRTKKMVLIQDHVQCHFASLLLSTVPPLGDSVRLLGAHGMETEETGREGRGTGTEGDEGGFDGTAGNPRGPPASASASASPRILWRLLARLLGGDTSSGLIPMPTMPVVDFGQYRRDGAAVVRSVVDELAWVWAGSSGDDLPLSAGCLEACRSVMDWSLSAVGPCVRSEAVEGMREGAGGRVGGVLGMRKVGGRECSGKCGEHVCEAGTVGV